MKTEINLDIKLTGEIDRDSFYSWRRFYSTALGDVTAWIIPVETDLDAWREYRAHFDEVPPAPDYETLIISNLELHLSDGSVLYISDTDTTYYESIWPLDYVCEINPDLDIDPESQIEALAIGAIKDALRGDGTWAYYRDSIDIASFNWVDYSEQLLRGELK